MKLYLLFNSYLCFLMHINFSFHSFTDRFVNENHKKKIFFHADSSQKYPKKKNYFLHSRSFPDFFTLRNESSCLKILLVFRADSPIHIEKLSSHLHLHFLLPLTALLTIVWRVIHILRY